MPFGLTNAPSTFQRFIHKVLRGLTDRGVIVYVDDILIYSDNLVDHVKLVQQVLERLRKHGSAVDIDKCYFHVEEVEFLGYVLGAGGLKMDKKKVQEIVDWPIPRSLKEVQSFLGFCNFYQRFIKGYSKIARPLI